MQIGEFARICKTKISILRHYDKEGLLTPDYVDNFTGYRYYSHEQIETFLRITALKKGGFSLTEIKQILSSNQTNEQLLSLFRAKRALLSQTLQSLSEAEALILSENGDMSVFLTEQNEKTIAKSRLCDANLQDEVRKELEQSLLQQGYQRISTYRTCGEPYSNQVYIACDVIKLSEQADFINEDTDVPFENDPSLVGKWQIIGEYAVKEDFYDNVCPTEYSPRDIYFLPDGKQYWCYAWSKGKLICRFGDSAFACDFDIEEHDGGRYMFVDFKSYEYRRGGKPTVLVLRQIDNAEYTAEELVRKDNIDLPFVDDPTVIGTWNAYGFCKTVEAFDPTEPQRKELFFKQITFGRDGEVISVYRDKTISGAHMQTWTKDYVLHKWDSTACAYRLKAIGGKEYLFVEWKSGDYLYGGKDACYYVFTR